MSPLTPIKVFNPSTKISGVVFKASDIAPGDFSGQSAETEILRSKLIDRANTVATQKITEGFQCNAIGTVYWYDSKVEDQLNLAALAAMNVAYDYPTRVSQNSEKVRRTHTAAQLKQVLTAGAVIKQGILVRCDEIKTLLAGKTYPQLQSIDSDLDNLWGLT